MPGLDLWRALKKCNSAEEIVDFLNMVEEGWFFEDMAKKIELLREAKKLQKKDWEDFLRKEGMPAELPLLRMVSIEEVSERELVSARKTPEVSLVHY